MLTNLVKRFYRRYFKSNPKVEVKSKLRVERHGSEYGGWNIIPDSLNSKSIVYSFGLGEDISFDTSIIKKYDCLVHGFDPTPRVKDWLNTQELPSKFIYHQLGIAPHDGNLSFYEPLNSDNISHTAIDRGNSNKIEVPCKKIASIMQQLQHTHIDLIKMDIEGFEYDVLTDLLSTSIKPTQLLVEFHHFFPEYGNAKTEEYVDLLHRNGYELFNISDSFCEYSFRRYN